MAVCIHSRSFCSVCWWLFLRLCAAQRRRCCKKWFVIQQIARRFSSARVMLFSCCKVTVRFPTKCFSHYFSCALYVRQVSQSIIDDACYPIPWLRKSFFTQGKTRSKASSSPASWARKSFQLFSKRLQSEKINNSSRIKILLKSLSSVQ